MKKILIVGSSGFIGKNIYEYLSLKPKEYELYTPNRLTLDCSNSVEVESYLKEHRFDVVIHSVGHSNIPGRGRNPKDTLDMTLKTFFNFERCNAYFGKMIYFGSGAEFDRAHYLHEMGEEYFDTFVPQDDYGYAKYLINKCIRNSNNIYNLRIFGLFGKYEYWPNKFIALSCCKAILDIPISIRQDVAFDWLYIDDLLAIVEWFIENIPKFNDYNLCSGNVHTLSDIAKMIVKIDNKKTETFICNKELLPEYSGSNNRIKNEIIDIKMTDTFEAIRELYNWYKASKDSLDVSDIFYHADKF